jgi:hypothetical protein
MRAKSGQIGESVVKDAVTLWGPQTEGVSYEN